MSREEAIEKLELMRQKVDEETYRALILAIKALEQEQKSGEWIRWYEVVEHEKSTEHIPHCKCSVCNREQDPHSAKFINFCPNCGARMIEPYKEEGVK